MKKRLMIISIAILLASCSSTEATRNPKPPCHPCKYPTPTTVYVL